MKLGRLVGDVAEPQRDVQARGGIAARQQPAQPVQRVPARVPGGVKIGLGRRDRGGRCERADARDQPLGVGEDAAVAGPVRDPTVPVGPRRDGALREVPAHDLVGDDRDVEELGRPPTSWH